MTSSNISLVTTPQQVAAHDTQSTVTIHWFFLHYLINAFYITISLLYSVLCEPQFTLITRVREHGHGPTTPKYQVIIFQDCQF